jgi:chemotaxis protein MotB
VAIETLRNRLTVITLQNDVLFGSGSAELTSRAKRALDEIAATLRDYPNRQILVEGHSDSIPLREGRIYPSNWELSAARAAAAVRFLASHDGINPKQLTVTGYGKFRPVASNKTAEGRQLNRRIELRLLPEESWLTTPETPQLSRNE